MTIYVLFATTSIALVIAAATSVVAWRAVSEDRRRSRARIARLAEVLRAEERPDSMPVDAPRLLESAALSPGMPPSLALASAIGLAVVVGLAGTWMVVTGSADSPTPASAGQTSREHGAAMPHSAAIQPASLELVSLTHERVASGSLELHGEVHNPQNGATLEDVTAVALLFDTQGAYLTSGRAPLDTRTIGEGGNATFFIHVPDAANVGRYRVSFRTSAGIIPHTDRRDDH